MKLPLTPPKVKAPSIPQKGVDHIIDNFALSSFWGVGGDYSSFFFPYTSQ